MDGLGIRAGGMAVLFDDGAPTFLGLVSIVVAIGMVLVGLKVIPEQLAGETEVFSGSVLMEVSWTDTNGNSHNGKIWIGLYNETPMHSASFRANADAARYDGTIFHRIVDGFMLQGGDFENGDGTGGHAGQYFGYCANAGFEASTTCENDMTNWVIPAEFGQTHDPGVIAAARSGHDNSAGSQFYLVDSTGASQLDGQYTAFGKAYKGEIDGQEVEGITVIDAISQVGCGPNQDPCNDDNKLSTYPVTIQSVTLVD
jgi:cyclophilin family peptidyl-prolyl cis-trans isomerase